MLITGIANANPVMTLRSIAVQLGSTDAAQFFELGGIVGQEIAHRARKLGFVAQ